MIGKTKTQGKTVRKEFLRGKATDEHTLKSSLLFLGSLVLVYLMSFILCITTAGATGVLRILVSSAIVILVMAVYFNKGSVLGAEAVSHGEILWQRQEKGLEVAESERGICFHPLKAFAIGLIGTLPLILMAVVFSVSTQVQTTTAGALPSWIEPYMRRDEISAPLVAYTQTAAMSLQDILRLIIRIMIMPFINLAGSENYTGVYWIEKLSPLFLMLPAIAYGVGYLTGPDARARIHTAISANEKRRKRREKRERRIRAGITAKRKEPEKLN